MRPLDFVALGLAPILSLFLSRLFAASERYRRIGFYLLVLLSAEYYYKDLWFTVYRGTSRGFSISLPDLITWGYALMLLWQPPEKYRPLIGWPRGMGVIISFASWGTVTTVTAMNVLYASFTTFKLWKAVVLFWTVANLVRTDDDLRLAARATSFTLVWLGCEVIWQKYVTHLFVIRAQGPFSHSNTLAMWVNLTVPMALGSALAVTDRSFGLLHGAAVYLGAVCVIFTKSRGGLAMLGFGIVGTLALSYWNRLTSRKAVVLAVVSAAAVVTGAVAAPRLIARFRNADPSSAQARVRFNEAARRMAADSFMGVGLNNYSLALGTTKYYYDVYPEFVDDWRPAGEETSRLGVCHHVYNLVMAETGYVGLGCFVAMLAWLFVPVLVPALGPRRPDGPANAVAIGLLLGLATMHLQGLLEWVLFQGEMLNLFFICSAVAEGVNRLDRRPVIAPAVDERSIERRRLTGKSPWRNATLPIPCDAPRPPASTVPAGQDWQWIWMQVGEASRRT